MLGLLLYTLLVTATLSQRPAEVAEGYLEQERSYIAHYEEQFLPVVDSGVCPLGTSHVSIAIGILSTAKNFDKREAIRETWMQLPNKYKGEVAYTFFLALQPDGSVPDVAEEMALHGDISILNHVDSRSSIVLKVMAIFRWGVRRCQASYVMKLDDDVYVRLESLLEGLFQHPPVAIYAGELVGSTMTRYFDGNDEAMPRSLYPSNRWPMFMQGGCYTLSRDLASVVAAKTEQPWFRPVPADEVSVAVWLGSHQPNYLPLKTASRAPAIPCAQGAVVEHYASPGLMRRLYSNYVNKRPHCEGFGAHVLHEKIKERHASSKARPVSFCRNITIQIQYGDAKLTLNMSPKLDPDVTLDQFERDHRASWDEGNMLGQVRTMKEVLQFKRSFPNCFGEERSELLDRLRTASATMLPTVEHAEEYTEEAAAAAGAAAGRVDL